MNVKIHSEKQSLGYLQTGYLLRHNADRSIAYAIRRAASLPAYQSSVHRGRGGYNNLHKLSGR